MKKEDVKKEETKKDEKKGGDAKELETKLAAKDKEIEKLKADHAAQVRLWLLRSKAEC